MGEVDKKQSNRKRTMTKAERKAEKELAKIKRKEDIERQHQLLQDEIDHIKKKSM